MLSAGIKFCLTLLAIAKLALSRTDTINSDSSLVPPAASCYDGAYAVRLPPFDSCSGFRKCEVGSYCENGVKLPCPAGYFGDQTGLNSSKCSGLCPPGFFCPTGTANSESKFCGNAGLYCPLGSSVPIKVTNGYYTVDNQGSEEVGTALTRSRQIICPRGYFCIEGVKQACPGGTYGSTEGLDSPSCSGLCPEGWYCPPASTQPYAFSCISGHSIAIGNTATKYCPEGSERPIPTAEGYYAVSSHHELGGGFGQQVICPRGSYCIHGVRHLCPAGRYGLHLRVFNASCTGVCTAGFYCPEESITDKQVRCPDAASYCPTASPAPVLVSPGYYTVGHETSNYTYDIIEFDGNAFAETARTGQAICEPGYYCLSDGIKRKCPVGRYGSTRGLSSPSCSGYCAAGYYCEEGSVSDKQYPCGGADKFCPPGSTIAQSVHVGYYTVQLADDNPALASAERRCEPGFYCSEGVKALCAPGTWGGEFGLHRANCSGVCAPGHYCPEGSISAIEKRCGDADKYCPGSNFQPIRVNEGYFSVGGNVSTRTGQQLAPPGHYAFNGILYVCPAGYYGATSGLSTATCSGPCSVPGYYCPAGSTSPVMRYCGGDDVFCPPFTVAPIRVHSGFYTADYMYEVCPPGQWRNLTKFKASNDPTGHSPIVTQQALPLCELCPNGTYKSISGDYFSQCLPCEEIQSISSADRITCDCLTAWGEGYTSQFNISTGLCQKYLTSEIPLIDASQWLTNTSLTRHRQMPCEAGHYCIDGLRYKCPRGYYGALTQETRPFCEGVCTQGYYCLESSTSPTSYPCGGAEWICPERSHTPLLVPPGWYSNEDVPEKLRYSSKICPVGHYCPGDGRRYPCSKGTFTDKEGTIEAACMGSCDRGHYCLEASPSRTQFQCGNTTVYCPRGSFQPTPILPGFYGLFTGADAGETRFWSAKNATYSAVVPCEPGYYCNGGVKNACPPGTFGWRYGMTTSQCGGLCAPGYYCPSYMAKQPDAPEYTVWPGKPHLTATDLECGRVGYYCPQGSFYPLLVGGGNYSIGGSAHNRTRTAQVICPPGSYCANSIPVLCPMGRYGSTAGLKDAACTGLCPAGFYCPGGTVNPLRCPSTEYSTGRASECSTCPGGRTTPLLCQTEKSCCNRG